MTPTRPSPVPSSDAAGRAPRPTPPDTREHAWELRIGFPPLVVHAFERADRRGVVFARWTDPAREGRDRRRKVSLDVRVRGDDGRLDPALITAAEAKVRALYTGLIAGRPPTPGPGGDTADWATGWTPAAGPIPLAAGFALALQLGGAGMYAQDTRRRQDVRRAADSIMRVLGRDTAWADCTPSRVAGLWRALARRRAETARGGPRDAEVVVAALYAVAQWLRDNEQLPPDACRAPRGWRARLKADWEAITGTAVVVARPRHTAAEMRAIFAALPAADPRIRLAVELGAELRIGQVLRTTRLDLDLTPHPEHPDGALRVRGRGRKRGELVVLTPEQRAAVDASLAGHLREFEAHFRAGTAGDYPLFPGSKLAAAGGNDASDAGGGTSAVTAPVARFRWPPRAFNRRTALNLFHALEAAAGVPSVTGRGWYGLRRQATDLAPQYTTDDRVLDRVGGPQRDTRERIYQDRHNLRLAREAATVRRALRAHAPAVRADERADRGSDGRNAASTSGTQPDHREPLGTSHSTPETIPETAASTATPPTPVTFAPSSEHI